MIATCAHLLAASQWTLIDAELDAGTELDATAWRSVLDRAQREVQTDPSRPDAPVKSITIVSFLTLSCLSAPFKIA